MFGSHGVSRFQLQLQLQPATMATAMQKKTTMATAMQKAATTATAMAALLRHPIVFPHFPTALSHQPRCAIGLPAPAARSLSQPLLACLQALHAVAQAKLEQQVALLERRNTDLEVHFRKALEERDRVRTALAREQTITAQVGG